LRSGNFGSKTVKSGDVGIEKVGGKINLADTLTKHSDSGSLDIHIKGTDLEHRIGRHSEAPDVAGDEVIENIVWGTNQESNERCGIESEGNKGEVIGHVHMCVRLKPSRHRVKGEMAAAEPVDTGEARSRDDGKARVRESRSEGTKLRDEEMARFADIQSGAVADRENMRQVMLGKLEEEEKHHNGNIRDIKGKHEWEIENEDGKHKDKVREIERAYEKEMNAFAGVVSVRESELKHEYEQKREIINERVIVAGLKVDIEDDEKDFGNFQVCNVKAGMGKFEGALEKEGGERVYGDSKSLLEVLGYASGEVEVQGAQDSKERK